MLGLPWLHPLARFGPLILRLGVAVVFIGHGWQKWQSGPEGWLAGGGAARAGFPDPVTVPLAWAGLIVELIGGLLLIPGLFTRIWAILQSLIMLVVIFTIKTGAPLVGGREGPSIELEVALLAGLWALALLGPGAWSLDQRLGLEGDSAT
jgi:putative oxidoreductase